MLVIENDDPLDLRSGQKRGAGHGGLPRKNRNPTWTDLVTISKKNRMRACLESSL